ncbi:unnamed protein product [Psylliodes chrysocephalus]|uniref:Uncharacterized protein n=1 Tax=Psylliodes chrysocephalus TaxID=3402493 RepID=A0A9P0CWG7_9CUCU|nr:unnamed protein product [Psylliodes chrysocephala]
MDNDSDTMSISEEDSMSDDGIESDYSRSTIEVNLSDYEDFEVLSLDGGEFEYKINDKQLVNNLKWICYEREKPCCVVQCFYQVTNIKLCNFCFYQVMVNFEENVNPHHINQHFTGSVDSILNNLYLCESCKVSLYVMCLAQYCVTCNNVSL